VIPFSAVMFPNTVEISGSGYPPTVQGGANPEPGPPVSLAASVQPKETRWEDRDGHLQARTRYTVSLNYSDDTAPVVAAVQQGDEIRWVDGAKTLVARGPVQDRGGYHWIWHIECDCVE
jgi:hypothetical protein